MTDRRFWVQDEQAIDRAATPERRLPTYVEELETRTHNAEARLKERLAQLDSENEAFRVRLRKEMEARSRKETRHILAEFLEVVDNLERALSVANGDGELNSLREGVEMNLRLFLSKLAAAGIEPLPVEGQPFDPHTSEAVGVAPVSDPDQDQRVVEVLQRGYLYGDELLRPAKVRVGHFAT